MRFLAPRTFSTCRRLYPISCLILLAVCFTSLPTCSNAALFDFWPLPNVNSALTDSNDFGVLVTRATFDNTTTNCTIFVSGTEKKAICDGETYILETAKDVPGSGLFFRDLILCICFVLIAGLMSGLTLGLLGMDTNTLEILKRQGTPTEQKYATRLLPIVKRHHLLLVTLLLTNAGAMEALPIFLNHLVPDWLAIIISVTAVLFFGEIIPQAICSRWALQIGGNIWWLVWGLMVIIFPLSWPISKLLDWILGHKVGVYYKRAQLKEFVAYHAASAFESDSSDGDEEEAGRKGIKSTKGDPDEDSSSSSDSSDDAGLPKEERLTNDEVLIIKGALDLTAKTVADALTPLEKVFSLNEASSIDIETLQRILDSGHSRIPVWRNTSNKIVGVILVKQLNLNYILEGGTVVRTDVKELPIVAADTPLYTMLNIFQTGKSHMAAVLGTGDDEKNAIGIITLEDIIEELIQEEIEDEMDLWRREHIRVRKTPKARRSSRYVKFDEDKETVELQPINRSKSSSVVRSKHKKHHRKARQDNMVMTDAEATPPPRRDKESISPPPDDLRRSHSIDVIRKASDKSPDNLT